MVFAKVKSFTFSELPPNPVKTNVFLYLLERKAELFTRFLAFTFGLRFFRLFRFLIAQLPDSMHLASGSAFLGQVWIRFLMKKVWGFGNRSQETIVGPS